MKRVYGVILSAMLILMTGCGGAGPESEGTTVAEGATTEGTAVEGTAAETIETDPSERIADIDAYKKGCVPVDYREFFRYEDKYKGTDVYQVLEVAQVLEDGDLRCYSASDDLSGDEYYVQDDRFERDMRILVDDKIIVWGTYDGTVKLTRAINDVQEEIFAIDAKIIELWDGTDDAEMQVQAGSGQEEMAVPLGGSPSGSGRASIPPMAEEIFGTYGGAKFSWYSRSTGYYLIPERTEDSYQIWFTVENDNTIWANTAYTVDVLKIEELPSGGIVCTGELYPAEKDDPESYGIIEVIWASKGSMDCCSVRKTERYQSTDTSMMADDYTYHGQTEDSIGVGVYQQDTSTYGEDEYWYLEFIFPYSDCDIIPDDEIAAATDEQLRIGKNEIYAMHGRMFDSQDLQEYFNGCSWYTPSVKPKDFDESVLKEIEKENIKRIQAEIDRRRGR